MRQLIENMKEEVRCDYLISSEMKQVWNIQLNMAVLRCMAWSIYKNT